MYPYLNIFFVLFFFLSDTDQTDTDLTAQTSVTPPVSVPTTPPPPPIKGKVPQVMEISGKKYVLVESAEGSKLIPIPETDPPKPVSPVKVVAPAEAKPAPLVLEVHAEVVSPIVELKVTTPEKAVTSGIETHITPITSAMPTKLTETKTTDTTPATSTSATHSDALLSVMLGNASYLCKMVSDTIGMFYKGGKQELIVFPETPSERNCYITPKTKVLPLNVNVPDIDLFWDKQRSSTTVRPKM